MRAITAAATLLVSTALIGGMTGCSQGNKAASDHRPSVVASTNVWGSVARAVAGDHASVQAIISNPADDPHSFEVTPADAASISDASLVVYNGGGYDHWVDDVLATHKDVPAVDAYSLLSASVPRPANEHVFYDLETAKEVAKQIAAKLSQVDASHADDYKTNADQFSQQADTIAAAERAIGASHPGSSVVATEPVAHYLLTNSGIVDKTPEGFTKAIEADTDPSPADLAALLDLIKNRQVSALVYNSQTQTNVTEQIQAAARQASVPIITVTETLPAGVDFLTWQRQTVDQLASQLDKAAQSTR
ncbi:metal ABC transporter solute-binding protein, Zn/Mn family [Mycobacterium sp. 3519A]|jgi:zinc/manganese transport system substrate-binding protein|uniref:metal ABC transporter solute-binding protein, Zn/Mn family n=1 Tax=Mycobacterium sp. 3519A TaxID=2057184 RepID=UPI000C7E7E38|nr:zinc ABC transporter substrate-binding protein [Mycobacterium sp. 3519A]